MPVVAAPAEVDTSGELAVEKSTDMAAVTLTSPDGQRALPVFSSMAALTRWDPAARPVPVTSARAAQAAVSERCEVMLLDLGAEHAQVLRPSMVWALAQERAWLPAHEDPFVAQALTLGRPGGARGGGAGSNAGALFCLYPSVPPTSRPAIQMKCPLGTLEHAQNIIASVWGFSCLPWRHSLKRAAAPPSTAP